MKKILDKIKQKYKTFNKEFKMFLINTHQLFKLNYKEVSVFVIACALCTLLGTRLFKNIFFDLIMEFNDVTYISPYNMREVFLSQQSIAMIIFFSLLITFFALFEIGGLLHAFSMGQIGRKTNLSSMCYAGFNTCKKALDPVNWMIVIFIMVLFPLTQVLPLSSSTFKVILPSFIYQTIDYTDLYTKIYRVVYTLLILGMNVHIFSIVIFSLEDSTFTQACKKSRILGKGRYIHTLLTLSLLTLLTTIALNSIASVIVINIRELVSFLGTRTGVVSKSSQIGTYTYFLRQVLKSLTCPIINNAALASLYYQYLEEKSDITEVSKNTFKEVNPSKTFKTLNALAVVLFITINWIYLANQYSYLSEDVETPYVCAHRGDNVHAPENTMDAFKLAESEGLVWIELDVHQTKDGVVVVNHDSDIFRTTGVKLSIHETNYDDLKDIEYLDSLPGDYEHVTMPTLEEALSFAHTHYMHVQVELKGHEDDINFEENVLDIINKTGMHDDVMIISQNYNRMVRINELDPTILKGYCMFFCYGNLEDIEATDNVSIEQSNVTPELVRHLHEQGMKVFCWTVDLEDTIQYLVSCGVDVIYRYR